MGLWQLVWRAIGGHVIEDIYGSEKQTGKTRYMVQGLGYRMLR